MYTWVKHVTPQKKNLQSRWDYKASQVKLKDLKSNTQRLWTQAVSHLDKQDETEGTEEGILG